MNDLKRRNSSPVRRSLTAGQGRLILLIATVAAAFAAVGILHASTRVAVVRAGYELSRVERNYRDLVREQERLKMERATLRSAQRLETIARNKLGMAPPTPAQLIAVRRALASAPAAAAAATGPVAQIPKTRTTATP